MVSASVGLVWSHKIRNEQSLSLLIFYENKYVIIDIFWTSTWVEKRHVRRVPMAQLEKITTIWTNQLFSFCGRGDALHTCTGQVSMAFQEKKSILLTIWCVKHAMSHDFFLTHAFEVCNLCMRNSYHPLHWKWTQYWSPAIVHVFFFCFGKLYQASDSI